MLPSRSALTSSSPAMSQRCRACSLRRCGMNFATAICRPVHGMTASGSRASTSSTMRRIRVSSASSRPSSAECSIACSGASRSSKLLVGRHRFTLQEGVQVTADLDRNARNMRGDLMRGPSITSAHRLRRGLVNCIDEGMCLTTPVGHGLLIPSLLQVLQDGLTTPEAPCQARFGPVPGTARPAGVVQRAVGELVAPTGTAQVLSLEPSSSLPIVQDLGACKEALQNGNRGYSRPVRFRTLRTEVASRPRCSRPNAQTSARTSQL